MMPRAFSLSAVLAFRQQKETSEERALTAILATERETRSQLATLERELVQITARRARETNTVQVAAHHQAVDARVLQLRDIQNHVRARLHTVSMERQEQYGRYLAARAGREMLTQLREQRQTECKLQAERMEQKRVEDLFTSRHWRS